MSDISDAAVANQLAQLRADYEDGLITDKGFAKRYSEIINGVPPQGQTQNRSSSITLSNASIRNSLTSSAAASWTASVPYHAQQHQYTQYSPKQPTLEQTILTANAQKHDSGVPRRSGSSSSGGIVSTPFSNLPTLHQSSTFPASSSIPSAPNAKSRYLVFPKLQNPQEQPKPAPEVEKELQKPLTPRDMSSINTVEKFDSLPLILRQRAKTYAKDFAIVAVSVKGRETNSINWEKLYGKAEKVAQQISKKSGLYKGDRVVLIYQDFEVIPFAVAFFGCLLAGMVAVPISGELGIKDVVLVVDKTQSKLCLVSDSVHKNFEKLESPVPWPDKFSIWRTEEMGTYLISKRHDPPALNLPDLAYIEFLKYPLELKGVVFLHKTIMHQMGNLTRIISSSPHIGSIQRAENVYKIRRDLILCSCDVRTSSGLVMGLLFTIYTGTMLVWMPTAQMDVPGLYANLITRYRSSVLVSDLLGLKSVAFNYQADPLATRKYDRKRAVDLSCVKWCIVACLTVNNEVLEIIADRWLRPLGCEHARDAIAPALSLTEYGGMVIAVRDWIGKEERLNARFEPRIADDDVEPYLASDLSEVLIDKDSLSTNTVKVISDRPPLQTANFDSKAYIKYVRVGAFGFPLLDATLAVVNPETASLTLPMEVGEIWVDSPCLSGGYWDLPEQTNRIFHARCRGNSGVLAQGFLRTGLLGFLYNGKVYVLGLYEDRFRQKVTWLDKRRLTAPDNGYRYHYADHIASTVFKRVAQVECAAFDIYVNGEYVPVIIIETALATKRIPLNTIDYSGLDALACETLDVLDRVHKVRAFCCAFTAVLSLPRAIKSGRTEIANMLCKTRFLQGSLKLVYVKFNIRSLLSNIASGSDIQGGIWSSYSSSVRRSLLPKHLERQYTGIDEQKESVDERSHARLLDFKTLLDVLKWRVLNQPDTLAFSSQRDKKDLSWRRFDDRVQAICHLIIKKTFLKPKNYVILMYNLTEEFICVLYACLTLGLIPIPMAPLDLSHVTEDVHAYFRIIRDFDVKMVLTNHDVETAVFKHKAVTVAIKNLFAGNHPTVVRSTTKAKPAKNISDLKSKISGYQAEFDFRDESTTVLVLLDWTADGRRIGVRYSHRRLMNLCKILKETFKMSSFNSIVAGTPYVSGLGFIQAALLGVYLGCLTYLLTPTSFELQPMLFYNTLANYKIKDTVVTPNMLAHTMSKLKVSKTFMLDKLQNIMVPFNGRPDASLIDSAQEYFSPVKIPQCSLNTVYSHRFNPVITARSYLNIPPFVLYLDLDALRQGYIAIVSSEHPNTLCLQDLGVVLCCTQIAIVNPETKQICKAGEYGEIWVYSEGNALGYTNGVRRNENEFLVSQFDGRVDGLDLQYLRTGDLGFIHTVSQPSVDGTPFDVQYLFVLGKIAETFEVMGLSHFASDVEHTVEKLHSDIYNGASLVFRLEDYTVVICCTRRSEYLAALVPIIFKNILNKHQLMVDIVAFLPIDQFEVSRDLEKKRMTMISKWNNNQLKFHNVYGVNYGQACVVEMLRQMELAEALSISEVSEKSSGTALSEMNEDKH